MVLKAKGLPVLFLPALYYPISSDARQTGFLMPSYGSSSYRGQVISNGFFWAIGRSQDATILHDWYSKTGQAVDGEYRYVSLRGGGQHQQHLHGRERNHVSEPGRHRNAASGVEKLQPERIAQPGHRCVVVRAGARLLFFEHRSAAASDRGHQQHVAAQSHLRRIHQRHAARLPHYRHLRSQRGFQRDHLVKHPWERAARQCAAARSDCQQVRPRVRVGDERVRPSQPGGPRHRRSSTETSIAWISTRRCDFRSTGYRSSL